MKLPTLRDMEAMREDSHTLTQALIHKKVYAKCLRKSLVHYESSEESPCLIFIQDHASLL